MYVAWLQADPVGGRQVSDGVRGVRVLDQLRSCRRAAREVEQQRLVGPRLDLGCEAFEQLERVVVAQPPVWTSSVVSFTTILGDGDVPGTYVKPFVTVN